MFETVTTMSMHVQWICMYNEYACTMSMPVQWVCMYPKKFQNFKEILFPEYKWQYGCCVELAVGEKII